MNIDWKEGAVCFAGGNQWSLNDGVSGVLFNDLDAFHPFDELLSASDFQLNEIKQGDCIESSELDTEQKYNDVVEVFGLFGFNPFSKDNDFKWFNKRDPFKIEMLVATEYRLVCSKGEGSVFSHDRKLTHPQIIAIGKLKRAMIEREKSPIDVSGFNTVEQSIEKRAKRNKARQAYKILNDLDYEYDLDKQKWYKKQYV